jgi:nicotinamide mononucleotide (NMN) deamidase PncC
MKKALLLALVLVPSVALAGGAGEKQDKKRDGLICREMAETGSRLSTKRVCMTREQWDQSRRETRETIERAQTRQTNPTGG